MINPETFDQLKAIPEKEWVDIYKMLILYAENRLKKVGFKARSEIDGGVNGEYFAALSIEKLFDGTRAWDFVRFPDVLIHLKGIAKSLIWSHLKKSKKAEVTTVLESAVVPDPVDDAEAIDAFTELTESGNPEELLISDETWNQIEKEFGDDVEGYVVFSDWLDGIPPRTIAANNGITADEVYNTLKRGRRIIKKIFAG